MSSNPTTRQRRTGERGSCTREIIDWNLKLRCRTDEAIQLVDHAVAANRIQPDMLTVGTDNGSAFTSCLRPRRTQHGVTHRRGGYRAPESQAFVESWFGKLKERLVWRSGFETLDQARKEIATYIDSYHHSPHSGLRYRTPGEVRQTWDDRRRLVESAD